MIARLLVALAALWLALGAAPALAETPDPAFRQFKAGEPLTLRPDKAYILVRLDTDLFKFGAQVMRVPSPEEIAAYTAEKRKAYDEALAKAQVKVAKNPKDKAVERLGSYGDFQFAYSGRPNLFEISPNRSLGTINKVATALIEVDPGDYVLYGMGMAGYLYECFCFGTVGFAAAPGQVTDLGTMIFAKAWEPSTFPELAGEVDLGRSAAMDYGLFAAGLRPARGGEALPVGLASGVVRPAALHAVGPFVETNVLLANRLAAVPGVLGYDGAKVIDVASGKELAPR